MTSKRGKAAMVSKFDQSTWLHANCKQDLSTALTYGQGTGAHQLVDFVTELTKVDFLPNSFRVI